MNKIQYMVKDFNLDFVSTEFGIFTRANNFIKDEIQINIIKDVLKQNFEMYKLGLYSYLPIYTDTISKDDYIRIISYKLFTYITNYKYLFMSVTEDAKFNNLSFSKTKIHNRNEQIEKNETKTYENNKTVNNDETVTKLYNSTVDDTGTEENKLVYNNTLETDKTSKNVFEDAPITSSVDVIATPSEKTQSTDNDTQIKTGNDTDTKTRNLKQHKSGTDTDTYNSENTQEENGTDTIGFSSNLKDDGTLEETDPELYRIYLELYEKYNINEIINKCYRRIIAEFNQSL